MFFIRKNLTGYKQVEYPDSEYVCMEHNEFRNGFIDITSYNNLVNKFNSAIQANKNLSEHCKELKKEYDELNNQYLYSDVGQIRESYLELEGETEGYKNRIAQLEYELSEEKNRNKKINEELKEKSEKLTSVSSKYAKLRDEAKNFADDYVQKENTIKNLMRINSQRANAMRGLTPKTTHTGYVVQSVNEFQQILSIYRGRVTSSKRCWKVYIQTPYMISEGISEEGFQKMLDLLGISEITNADKIGGYGDENVAFNIFRIDNYKDEFISYSLCCTQYPSVTEDMLPPKKTKS